MTFSHVTTPPGSLLPLNTCTWTVSWSAKRVSSSEQKEGLSVEKCKARIWREGPGYIMTGAAVPPDCLISFRLYRDSRKLASKRCTRVGIVTVRRSARPWPSHRSDRAVLMTDVSSGIILLVHIYSQSDLERCDGDFSITASALAALPSTWPSLSSSFSRFRCSQQELFCVGACSRRSP